MRFWKQPMAAASATSLASVFASLPCQEEKRLKRFQGFSTVAGSADIYHRDVNFYSRRPDCCFLYFSLFLLFHWLFSRPLSPPTHRSWILLQPIHHVLILIMICTWFYININIITRTGLNYEKVSLGGINYSRCPQRPICNLIAIGSLVYGGTFRQLNFLDWLKNNINLQQIILINNSLQLYYIILILLALVGLLLI